MTIRARAKILWIKQDFGGRAILPNTGLRPSIRFQKYINEWMSNAWDVEVIELEIDKTTWSSNAILQFSPNSPTTLSGLKEGELIELLDAYRVIGIGKIYEVTISP